MTGAFDKPADQAIISFLSGLYPCQTIMLNMKLTDLADLDSLDVAELEAALEEAFGVVIPERSAAIWTVGEVIQHITSQS